MAAPRSVVVMVAVLVEPHGAAQAKAAVLDREDSYGIMSQILHRQVQAVLPGATLRTECLRVQV